MRDLNTLFNSPGVRNSYVNPELVETYNWLHFSNLELDKNQYLFFDSSEDKGILVSKSKQQNYYEYLTTAEQDDPDNEKAEELNSVEKKVFEPLMEINKRITKASEILAKTNNPKLQALANELMEHKERLTLQVTSDIRSALDKVNVPRDLINNLFKDPEFKAKILDNTNNLGDLLNTFKGNIGIIKRSALGVASEALDSVPDIIRLFFMFL